MPGTDSLLKDSDEVIPLFGRARQLSRAASTAEPKTPDKIHEENVKKAVELAVRIRNFKVFIFLICSCVLTEVHTVTVCGFCTLHMYGRHLATLPTQESEEVPANSIIDRIEQNHY